MLNTIHFRADRSISHLLFHFTDKETGFQKLSQGKNNLQVGLGLEPKKGDCYLVLWARVTNPPGLLETPEVLAPKDLPLRKLFSPVGYRKPLVLVSLVTSLIKRVCLLSSEHFYSGEKSSDANFTHMQYFKPRKPKNS